MPVFQISSHLVYYSWSVQRSSQKKVELGKVVLRLRRAYIQAKNDNQQQIDEIMTEFQAEAAAGNVGGGGGEADVAGGSGSGGGIHKTKSSVSLCSTVDSVVVSEGCESVMLVGEDTPNSTPAPTPAPTPLAPAPATPTPAPATPAPVTPASTRQTVTDAKSQDSNDSSSNSEKDNKAKNQKEEAERKDTQKSQDVSAVTNPPVAPTSAVPLNLLASETTRSNSPSIASGELN